MTIAAIVAAVVGLQLGAFGVVLETYFSGISSLPFKTFVLLMQPIHLAIGVVEGLVTVAIVSFVYKARPEILQGASALPTLSKSPMRALLFYFFVAALLTGGFVSWYASENPDGLEWAIAKVTGKEEVEAAKDGIHSALSAIQEKTAFLPDYSFKKPDAAKKETAKPETESKVETASRTGTSLSGIVGAIMTLVVAFVIGFLLKMRNRSTS
jgi:cobalt/nickel transport system permease protein